MEDLVMILEVLSPSKQNLGWFLSCKLPLFESPNLCSFFKFELNSSPKLQQYDEEIAAITNFCTKKIFDDRNGALEERRELSFIREIFLVRFNFVQFLHFY